MLDHRRKNFAKFEAGQVGPMAATLAFGRNNVKVASPVMKHNALIERNVFLVNTIDVV